MLLYIDPGTGSMLFTVLIGVVGAFIYFLRMMFVRLRNLVGKGKVQIDNSKIPFVIYSDDKRYWKIFEPILREMDARGQEVTYLTASEDDPVFKCDLPHVKAEYIGSGNRQFAKLNYLSACIVLSTTPGLEVYQWKKSKQADFYVHIPHATSELTFYRMFGIDYYDAIMLSGEYQYNDVRALEQLRGLPEKELPMIGIPYMDEMAKRAREAGPAPEHERTVLLAPSWGKSAIFGVYGGDIIKMLLGTGYHVIVRPHPQSFKSEAELMDKIMKEYPESAQLEWNRDNDNFDVLRRSDILISDFSGVIFDFTLINDKPVIYTNPDINLDVYDAWWLNRPIWTMSALPRLGCELNENAVNDLKQLIDECIENPAYKEGRAEVKSETWAHEGEGARRAVDYLMEKYRELSEKEDK